MTSNAKQLQALLASGRLLLERVAAEELDPRTVNAAYQEWYTQALAALQRFLPNRLEEFAGYYRATSRPETGSGTIADILASPSAPVERGSGLGEIFDPAVPRRTFLHLFGYQLAILGTVPSMLASPALEIRYLELLDAELAAARRLLKAGHRRSAGTLAGVVLGRYLRVMAQLHSLPVEKRMSLTELADLLGADGIYSGSRWRATRRLAQLADRCGPAGKRAPTRADVRGLISGVKETLRGLL